MQDNNYEVKFGNSDLIERFVTETDGVDYALDSYGCTNESCSWYEHEDQLKSFSLFHPETIFELHGEGEDGATDTWIKYFQDGKMQVCEAKITFNDFDPEKLK